MTSPTKPDPELEKRLASRLLDVLIRAGVIVAVVILCYRVFAPFLTLTVWALILAVTLYPLHRAIADKLNGRQGLSATLLVLLGIALLVAPTAVLMSSLGDTVQDFIRNVQSNSLEIPRPPDSVSTWPLVGKRIFETWSRAHNDLPDLVQSLQPKIGELARDVLAFVASIAGALLLFLGSFILAGIFMAFGECSATGRMSGERQQRWPVAAC